MGTKMTISLMQKLASGEVKDIPKCGYGNSWEPKPTKEQLQNFVQYYDKRHSLIIELDSMTLKKK